MTVIITHSTCPPIRRFCASSISVTIVRYSIGFQPVSKYAVSTTQSGAHLHRILDLLFRAVQITLINMTQRVLRLIASALLLAALPARAAITPEQAAQLPAPANH